MYWQNWFLINYKYNSSINNFPQIKRGSFRNFSFSRLPTESLSSYIRIILLSVWFLNISYQANKAISQENFLNLSQRNRDTQTIRVKFKVSSIAENILKNVLESLDFGYTRIGNLYKKSRRTRFTITFFVLIIIMRSFLKIIIHSFAKI
jgi:hypothetical protein